MYFIPGHIMIKSPVRVVADLIASGYKKDYDRRFHVFGPWSDIAKVLPPKARVLLHDNHNHLGIGATTVSDWGGWQFGISYGRMHSPREVYDTLSGMGVTYVTWEHGRSQASDSLAGDIMFYNFVFKYVHVVKSFGGVTLGKMPESPPPEEFEDTVAFLGCPKGGHKTGLYHVRDLTTPVFGPHNKKYKAPTKKADAETSPEELVKAASFVVVATKCSKSLPASARSAFRQTPRRRKVMGEQVGDSGSGPTRRGTSRARARQAPWSLLRSTKTSWTATSRRHDAREVTARRIWRWAAAKTASTGTLKSTLPAITMCQRTPVPCSRRSATRERQRAHACRRSSSRAARSSRCSGRRS